MTRVVLLAAVFLAALPALSVEPSRESQASLERKFHGTWDGYGPCDGELTLKPDGTYEYKYVGPAGNQSTGTWKIRWNALPPTLTLHCKASDDSDHVGSQEAWKVLRLDDAKLTVRYEKAKKRVIFTRLQPRR